MRLRTAAGPVVSWLSLALVLAADTLPARADEPPNTPEAPKRPKICLVLSGGGARGAAHVGVIKVLEEYRIPIDCIAGTSMGAVVGAAYASGMSVAEMEKFIASISTEMLFNDNPPREEQSMRQKEDDYRTFFGPEFGLKDGKLRLPKGVVTGVQLEAVLRGISKVQGFHHFDDLPIPFRAVATDLVTGKAVVFSEGELASVMRASMSVPGAVAPAEYGGKMLVDGMLTSNLPVQVGRSMGADIIIAVNVGTPLLARDQLTGILGVTTQMLSILTEQNVEVSIASLKPSDILISPELGGFSTGDFDHLPQIEPRGEAATRQMAERLRPLALPPAEFAALRKKQSITPSPDTRAVDEIRFEDLKRVNPQAAQAVMETKTGQPIDQQVLDADMRRLYGTGDFERVDYRFLEEPGRRVLAVDAVEKGWGPDYLRVGLGLSSDFNGDSFFNALASYRMTWLNALGAEWRTDAQVGRTSDLSTEFYQPLDTRGLFFVAPNLSVGRRTEVIYQGNDRISEYDINTALAGVYAGTQLAQYGEFRLGVVRGQLKPALDIGPQTLAPQSSNISQGAFTAQLVFDQIDSVRFPRSGWSAEFNVYDSTGELGADQRYIKWDSKGMAVYSFGEHTLNFAFKAGGRIGSDTLPFYDQFQWGGFLEQSGYATGQLLGQNLWFLRAMYYRRILQGTLFEGAFGGFSIESGKVDEPLVAGNPDNELWSASLFVAVDTPIGPVYLAYGRAAAGLGSFYFYLGRPF